MFQKDVLTMEGRIADPIGKLCELLEIFARILLHVEIFVLLIVM
jgi:hypothetical protein